MGDYNGLDVILKVRILNISDNDVICDINTVVNSKFYNGKKHKFVTQNVQNDVTIKTGEEFVFDVPVKFIQYYKARATDDFNSMSCNVVVKCNDSQKSICGSFNFNMPNQTENPHIQVFPSSNIFFLMFFIFVFFLNSSQNSCSDQKGHSPSRRNSNSDNHLHKSAEDSINKLGSEPRGIWFEFS